MEAVRGWVWIFSGIARYIEVWLTINLQNPDMKNYCNNISVPSYS